MIIYDYAMQGLHCAFIVKGDVWISASTSRLSTTQTLEHLNIPVSCSSQYGCEILIVRSACSDLQIIDEN